MGWWCCVDGLFRWVLACGEESGLVKSRGIGDSACSFAGGCWCRYGCGIFIVGVVGLLRVLVAVCMIGSWGTLGWVGEIIYAAGYVCV